MVAFKLEFRLVGGACFAGRGSGGSGEVSASLASGEDRLTAEGTGRNSWQENRKRESSSSPWRMSEGEGGREEEGGGERGGARC